MKIEIPLTKANRLVNSGQLILVTSGYQNKKNIVTLAWHMPVNHKPSLLGLSVAKIHFSAELIQKQKQFVVNIPDVSLLDKIIYCGTHSGREVDKFKETGLTPLKANRLDQVPLIEECIGHLECRLQNTIETGDHFLFIGEPVFACAQKDFFDETWKVDRVKLVYHLGGKFFTTSSGEIS